MRPYHKTKRKKTIKKEIVEVGETKGSLEAVSRYSSYVRQMKYRMHTEFMELSRGRCVANLDDALKYQF